MGMISEFKDFAAGGNLVDVAVGFVMGAAFATVVKSLIADIVMPIVSGVFSLPDFSEWAIPFGDSAIRHGNFINSLISFLLLAFVLFLLVRGISKIKKAAAAETPANEVLLAEIRDLLKK